MPGVDDYLHEAALANDPPSATFYDPDHEGDVERLASLGVHEHWNNSTDMQYSRNLGTGDGIELIVLRDPTGVADPISVGASPASGELTLSARPNPFNPSTSIEFELTESAPVTLRIHDAEGRVVRTLVSEWLEAERHAVMWDGRNDADRIVASGVYLCRLDIGGRRVANKLVLMR